MNRFVDWMQPRYRSQRESPANERTFFVALAGGSETEVRLQREGVELRRDAQVDEEASESYTAVPECDDKRHQQRTVS
jgi:hypothetical protein